MVTSAQEWRKPREIGVELVLPSLKTARIRPIDVDFFVMHGKVPDPLADALNRLLNGENLKDLPTISAQEQLGEKRDQWIPFLNQLASYALIEPKCKDGEPGTPLADDEISVWDLSYADKVAIYRLFCRPADYLEKFRDFQAVRLAPVYAATGNGHSGEQAVTDSAVGEPGPGDAGSDDGTGR